MSDVRRLPLRSTLSGLGVRAVALSAGLVASFFLFVSIPALQRLIAPQLRPPARPAGARTTLIEKVKPPEKKEQRVSAVRVRQVGEGRAPGPAGEGLPMRFAPDLSVEGAGGAGVAASGGDLAAEIFEENETDEKPAPLFQPPVPYPQRATELGIQGVMEAEIIIDRTGKVESVNIVKSPHPSFAAEARRVMPTWRFKPARNKGVPVKVRVRQTIEFKLD